MLASKYQNLISSIDVDRGLLEYFSFHDLATESKFQEFMADIQKDNDTIELSLIRNNAYREGVILPLISNMKPEQLAEMLAEEQHNFAGSKLFYVNDQLSSLLIVSVPGSIEGKVRMVLTRLNKINDKIHRLNGKIRKENSERAQHHSMNDKREIILEIVNKQLRV